MNLGDLFLLLDGGDTGDEVADFLGHLDDGAVVDGDGGLESADFTLGEGDSGLDDGLLAPLGGLLELLLKGDQVGLGVGELLEGGLELQSGIFQDLLLLAQSSVDAGLELLVLLLQALEQEALLEASVLHVDDLLLGGLLGDLGFLGLDDNISDDDLLINVLLVGLGLLEALAGVGKLSSRGGLGGDKLLSLGGEGLELLPAGGDLGGQLVDLLLDLALLVRGGDFEIMVQLLAVLDVAADDDGDVLDLDLDGGDSLRRRGDVGLQSADVRGVVLDLGVDLLLLGDEFLLLVNDLRSKLLINLDGSLINLLTGIDALLSFFLELSGKLVLDILNLLVDVSDLLLDVGGLRSDNLLSDLLSLDLLLDEANSLLSLLGDSGRGGLLELRLVDLSSLLIDNGLGGLVVDDLVRFFVDDFLLSSLLIIDVLVFDISFSVDS